MSWSFTTVGALPDLIITEIMYNPDTPEGGPALPEWVEIYNADSVSVDLTGLKLDDEDSGASDDWGAIASGTLDAGKYAVLFDSTFTDETTFRSEWSVPVDALVIAVTWGNLSGNPTATSEILQLQSATANVIDEVNYDDSGDWPSDSPDGPSIALITTAYDDVSNDTGTNWVRSDDANQSFAVNASGPTFSTVDRGSPGFDGTGTQPGDAFAAWLSDNGYAATGFDTDSDGDGDSNGAEWYFFGTSPDAVSNNGSPVSEVTPTGSGTFTFTHRRPVNRVGVTEAYKYSLNLDGTWNPSDATVDITPGATVPDGPDYEIVTVTVTVDPPTTAQVFVRLEISETP